MNSCSPQKLAATAVLALVLAGLARADQPIIFSKPAEASSTTKADSNLAPETQHETRSLFSLPPTFFEPARSSQPLAGAPAFSQPQPATPDQQKAWRNILDKKDKWTLMTPEEIMGIPTPEKILGLPDKNGDDKLTLEERYTRRMERKNGLATEPSANNKLRPDALVRNQENVFARKSFESVFAKPEEKNLPGQPAASANAGGRNGSFFNSLVNSPFAPANRPETRWGNAFNLPQQPPRPTPEQLAGMDRFRQTLQPAAVFEKAAEPLRAQAAAVPRRDPFMNVTPDFNPRGSSFTPLKTDVTRPRGLTPLPGITYRPPVVPTRSPMQPDLPPWLRNDGPKKLGEIRGF